MSRYLFVLGVLALGVAAAGAGAGPAAASKSTPTSTPTPTPTLTPTPNLAYPYTMTDLGSLGLGVSYGLAISANGQVTGYSYLSTQIQVPCPPRSYDQQKKCFIHPYHAFLYSNGTMKDLGTLGGTNSEGYGINSSGEVVGSADTNGGGSRFLWTGQTMVDIGAWGASGINDLGQITGTCSSPALHACLYSNGTLTPLPNPSSFAATSCGAAAINKNSQIAGSCADPSGNVHAVVWQNGTAADLGTLGAGPPFQNNNVSAINNLGQVVGWQQISTGANHGFLLSNGTMTDLGLDFLPAAINDNGVVVGNLIYRNATLQNLNNLVPPGSAFTLGDATGINDNGQIVVNGYNYQGQEHAFLLNPTG